VRHLVVAAHPSTQSFNRAVVKTYIAALRERRHRVECRDLYAAHFNPILSARDLAAIGHCKAAPDVRREQAAIRQADVITLIAPMWWSGFPAMLKGYIDRVFCAGFAYVRSNKANICPGSPASTASSSPHPGRTKASSKAAACCARSEPSTTKA